MVHNYSETFTPISSNQLKSNVDLRTIAVNLLGEPIRKTASTLMFSAPERRDSNPSLCVNQTYFKDFGNAQHKGDVFSFLEIYAGLDFKTAWAYLTNTTDFTISTTSATSISHQKENNTPSRAWKQRQQERLQQFQRNLWRNPDILAYLHAQGYDNATIQAQQLGYNPRWQHKIAPGIVFPRYGEDGELAALKIRCPHTNKEGRPDALARAMQAKPFKMKYMSAPGSKLANSIYGNLDQTNAPLIVTEGEKDRDNVAQRLAGYNVITMGSATNSLPVWVLERIKASNPPYVLVLSDHDDAGLLGAHQLHQQLAGILQCTVKVITPPMGKDSSLRRLIETTPNLLDHTPTLVTSDHFHDDGTIKDITDAILAGLDVAGWIAGEVATLFSRYYSKYLWANGVPDNLRTAIMNIPNWLKVNKLRLIEDHTSALMVYEGWQDAARQGLVHADAPVAAPWLQEILAATGYNIAIKTIQRALEQLDALGFIASRPNLDPESICEYYQGSKFGRNPNKAHQYYQLVQRQQALKTFKAKLYSWLDVVVYLEIGVVLPDIAEHAVKGTIELTRPTLTPQQKAQFSEKRSQRYQEVQRLLGKIDNATPLVGDYHNARTYRIAFYKGLVTMAGGERVISRKAAAHQLGVSDATLSNIRKALKIATEDRFVHQTITSADHLQAQLATVVPGAALRSYGVWVEAQNKHRLDTYRKWVHNDNLEEWVRSCLNNGDQVYFKVQVASREYFASETEWKEVHELRQMVYQEHRERMAHILQHRKITCRRQPPHLKARTLAELPRVIADLQEHL